MRATDVPGVGAEAKSDEEATGAPTVVAPSAGEDVRESQPASAPEPAADPVRELTGVPPGDGAIVARARIGRRLLIAVGFLAIAAVALVWELVLPRYWAGQAATLVERGSAAFEAKDYDVALAALTEAIRLSPTSAVAFFKRGIVYDWGKPDHDRAVSDFTEAIRLDAGYVDAFFFRGVSYQNFKHDLDLAIADYSEAIRLDATWKSGLAFYNRGLCYLGKNDHDRAIADFTEKIRLDATYAPAVYWRGVAKQRKGDVAGGKGDIAKAKQLDPNVDK